jgi:phosphoribosylaminoimidazole-succinocarboxamide synthase
VLSTAPLLETSLDGLTLNRRGKVRDVYDITLASGDDALLIVATDRISAFDYVLAQAFPTRERYSRSYRDSGSSGWAISCRTI